MIQLPDMTYDELLRSGFSPESLVRTTREGRWKLVLGPGALLRVSLAGGRPRGAGQTSGYTMYKFTDFSARLHLLLLDHGV